MKKLIISSCILCAVIFSGCELHIMNSIYSNENKISSETNSFTLNDNNQIINDQEYEGKINFEGMDTIWTFNAEEESEVEISYVLSVNKGSAKLVLIKSDGTLETLIESSSKAPNDNATSTKLSLKKGEHRIKLVAKNDAEIDLQFKASKGKINKIGFDK